MRHVGMVRTGRNANGFSRDGGQLVHAVPLEDTETRLPDGSGRKAACGAQPQGIAYWGDPWRSHDINCQKCLKRISPNSGDPR
jgi:hypothetical protein